ncbi:MAG: aminotransferase class IV [Gammaproteobacteria bacterium]|nr:aminotransferase class IV [Gammaproteobacteria bacterium]
MTRPEGAIAEGVPPNLVPGQRRRLSTPVIDHRGVAGKMRGFILDVVAPELALNAEQVHYERALLCAAQEVFLCNAVIGVRPVRQLRPALAAGAGDAAGCRRMWRSSAS